MRCSPPRKGSRHPIVCTPFTNHWPFRGYRFRSGFRNIINQGASMKKIVFIMVIALGAYMVPCASAQNHGEAGIFADYLRPSPMDTNSFGLGARLSVNVHPNVQLEGEMSYDFARDFTEHFTVGPSGVPTVGATTTRTGVRILHGLFGPKFQTGGQAIRAFFTVKGGFVNFRFDDRPATFGTFTSSVQ